MIHTVAVHVHTLCLQSCMSVSAFVYLVGLKEFTSGRDDTEHVQAHHWLPLE